MQMYDFCKRGKEYFRRICRMKKVHLFSLVWAICLVIGVGVDVYDVSSKKASNWTNFMEFFQGIELPDRADVIKTDILDRVGSPFGIRLVYRSQNDMARELERYRPMLEREQLIMEKANDREYAGHSSNGLLHFSLAQQGDEYRRGISNGRH